MMLYLACGACAAIILLWFLSRHFDPRRQILNGNAALGIGNTDGARMRFLRAIALLEAGKGKAKERDELAAKAHLAVAEIELGIGVRDEAAAHYRKAKSHGAELPMEAVLLLAEFSAEKEDSSEEAVTAYLTYLASGSRTGTVAERVYSTLQSICKVTEDMKPAQRKPAAELNRKVIAISPGLEWAHYYSALASLLDGRAGEAIKEFSQASSLNPSRPLTFYWLAVGYLQLPSPSLTDAIEALERFLSMSHDDARTRKRETRVCAEVAKRLIDSIGGFNVLGRDLDAQRQNSLDRAIHYLEEAIKRAPDDATIHFDLGRAYRLKGTRTNAEEAFRRASFLNAHDKTYAYELGMECAALGRTEDAIEALERAIEIDPEYEEAHDILGQMRYEAQDYRKAAEHWQSALGSGKRNPRRFALFVQACYHLGDFVRVVEGVDQRKADPSPFDGDAEAAYATGRSYSVIGRFEEAISWLQKAKVSAEARYFLSCAHANLGQYPEALACFESLVDSASEWSQKAVVQQAHVLRMQGNVDQAKALYRRAKAADRNDFEATRALGQIALAQGELVEAISHFGAAATLRPEDLGVHYELGVALERHGELDQALSYYQAASEGRSDSRTCLRMGIVECRLGRFSEAIQTFQACGRAADLSDALLFYRGLAFAVLGQCPPAIRDWTELQQRHPDHERLQLNLARVHYVQGSKNLAQGKPEAAIENWENYLKCYSMDESVSRDVAELHFRCATELIRSGTPDVIEAARCGLEAATQRDPQNRTYRLYQALFEGLCGANTEETVSKVRALAAEDQQDPGLCYHLGWCLLQCGESSESVQLFNRVRHMPNANNYARYASWAQSNVMISDGDYEDAINVLIAASSSELNASHEVQP